MAAFKKQYVERKCVKMAFSSRSKAKVFGARLSARTNWCPAQDAGKGGDRRFSVPAKTLSNQDPNPSWHSFEIHGTNWDKYWRG